MAESSEKPPSTDQSTNIKGNGDWIYELSSGWNCYEIDTDFLQFQIMPNRNLSQM